MSIPEQGSPEWLRARRQGVGGSDIVVLAGLADRSSPYALWAEKRGELPPVEPTADMIRGKLLEEPVARWWAADTGERIRRRRAILRHPTIPWATASLDREVVGKRAILEVKTTRRRWDDGLPDDVIAQCQWYLGVSGAEVCHVAALTGGLSFDRWELAPDPGYFADLVDIGADFWQHVREGRPPAIDGTEATRRALLAAHPADRAPLVRATAEAAELVAKLRAATLAADAATAEVETFRNALRAIIGDAAGIEGPGFRVTWKKSADREVIDWQAVGQALAREHPGEAAELLAAATRTVTGPRVLRPWWED